VDIDDAKLVGRIDYVAGTGCHQYDITVRR
jgi:hypothetical protein